MFIHFDRIHVCDGGMDTIIEINISAVPKVKDGERWSNTVSLFLCNN